MHVRIGCEFIIESSAPTPTACIVRPRDRGWHTLLIERRSISPDVPIEEYVDSFGNHVWRWTAPEGRMILRYDAIAAVPPEADPLLVDLPGTLVDALPDEVLMYTLPSRHSPSDLVIGTAWEMFGNMPDGSARVQAICDWAHQNIVYGYGNSTSTTSSYDAFLARGGVCRDFAHIAVMFCRAMNIPPAMPAATCRTSPSPITPRRWTFTPGSRPTSTASGAPTTRATTPDGSAAC